MAFEEPKCKISEAPIFSLPNVQKPFDIETNANGYAMGVALM